MRDYYLMTAHSFPGAGSLISFLFDEYAVLLFLFFCLRSIIHILFLLLLLNCPGRSSTHTQACVSRAEEMKSGGRDPIKGLGQRC